MSIVRGPRFNDAVVPKINPVPVLFASALELVKNEYVAVLPVSPKSARPVSLKMEFDTVYALREKIIA